MSLLLTRLLLRFFLALLLKPRPARRERGDVPGWVLITVMTAGLVVLIWGVAGDQLKTMLQNALNSVSNK
ncbi:hypothetical protein [Kribbella sp. NPDC055071]